MVISELVAALEVLWAEHGDLPVTDVESRPITATLLGVEAAPDRVANRRATLNWLHVCLTSEIRT